MTTLERTPTSREQAQSGEQTQPRLAQRDTPQPPTARLHRDALRQAELEQARAKGRHAAEREQLRWITAVAGALFVVAAITGSGALLGGGVMALLIVIPIMLASSVTAGRIAECDARLQARRRKEDRRAH